jgi:hypothetical protein
MEKLGSQRTDFNEIWYLNVFRKFVKKVQVLLTSDKNNGTLHEDLCTILIICRWIHLRMRNVSDKICRENQNTYFVFSNFFRKWRRLWENVNKWIRARQAKDDNMAHAHCYWILKATKTHSEYVVLIAFLYYNNGCMSASQCYFIRTLPVLLCLSEKTTLNRNVLWVQNMPNLSLELLFW